MSAFPLRMTHNGWACCNTLSRNLGDKKPGVSTETRSLMRSRCLHRRKRNSIRDTKDLDAVQHTRMDRDTAQADLEKLGAERAVAEWLVVRVTFPQDCPVLLLRELRLRVKSVDRR